MVEMGGDVGSGPLLVSTSSNLDMICQIYNSKHICHVVGGTHVVVHSREVGDGSHEFGESCDLEFCKVAPLSHHIFS